MRQFLAPNETGLINCILVKAISTKDIRKVESEYICGKCVLNYPPFKCDAFCSCRPACMANDIDNLSNEPVIYVMMDDQGNELKPVNFENNYVIDEE